MSHNIITLTRGDTFDFDVKVYEEAYGDYFAGALPGDIVEFSLYHPNGDEAILTKSITLKLPDDVDLEDYDMVNLFGNCTFSLEHTDTKNLPIGVYYYTVKLIRPGTTPETKQVITIINRTKFVLNR
jgi:hypothetical protein